MPGASVLISAGFLSAAGLRGETLSDTGQAGRTAQRPGTGRRDDGPVTLLVIGAGSRGTAYAGYALRHPGEARVVAVAEPRSTYRDRLADHHQIPAEMRFADWREALARDQVADAVVVATPDLEHVDPVVAFAARGYAVLVEKPMATTEADCERLVEAVERAGVVAAVAHVMRYTPYTQMMKSLLDAGAVGDIVSIDHVEPVGFWHFAHSYVRGNWRRSGDSGSALLAKCCHDLDWLSFLIGRPCRSVSSFGGLAHFRADQRPAGAGERCTACDVEETCAFSARRLYLGMVDRGVTGWPVDVVAWPATAQNVTQALTDGPYGRCVWACDNDVVDHQVVSLRYDAGITATLTMTGFSRMRDRETRIFGTRGELRGDGAAIEVYDFLTDTTTRHDTRVASDGGVTTGHGGGDDGVMADFLAAVAAEDAGMVPTSPADALTSHRIAFAAERARQEEAVIAIAR